MTVNMYKVSISLIGLGGLIILLGGIETYLSPTKMPGGNLPGAVGVLLGAAITFVAFEMMRNLATLAKRKWQIAVPVVIAVLSLIDLGGFFIGWVLVFAGAFGLFFGMKTDKGTTGAAERRTARRPQRRKKRRR